jgi:hypothetical protein
VLIVPSGEQITVAAGDQQAVIIEVGGGLRSYSAGGRQLVDGYSADDERDSRYDSRFFSDYGVAGNSPRQCVEEVTKRQL